MFTVQVLFIRSSVSLLAESDGKFTSHSISLVFTQDINLVNLRLYLIRLEAILHRNRF